VRAVGGESKGRCRTDVAASIKFLSFVSVGKRVLLLLWTHSNPLAVLVARHESNWMRRVVERSLNAALSIDCFAVDPN
jgi:hypothetical protein